MGTTLMPQHGNNHTRVLWQILLAVTILYCMPHLCIVRCRGKGRCWKQKDEYTDCEKVLMKLLVQFFDVTNRGHPLSSPLLSSPLSCPVTSLPLSRLSHVHLAQSTVWTCDRVSRTRSVQRGSRHRVHGHDPGGVDCMHIASTK